MGVCCSRYDVLRVDCDASIEFSIDNQNSQRCVRRVKNLFYFIKLALQDFYRAILHAVAHALRKHARAIA